MARIAFIDVTVTVSYGGVQTAVWRLAEALARAGHEIAVLGGHGPIRPDDLPRNISVYTFPFVSRERVPDFGSRFQRIVERLSMARHARRAVVAGGYDWAILTKPFDFYWPWLMPAQARTRFAFLSEGTDFFAGDRRLARRIDGWLACSHFNAWQVHAHYKRWPTVIFNGVDVDKFAPGHIDTELRARVNAKDNDVLFAFAGRLVGWKGMSVAVRAMAEPALRDLPVKLVIVGEGPQQPELGRLAHALDVTDRVSFHGAVPHDRLPGIYAASDVGVFPSIGDEAFGITIAEAMSCGKPVIASHIGGIPEVVGNEHSCGLLVAPGDPAALAEAMRTLALDASARERMGAAARERIVNLYTWRASAERLGAALGF